MVDVDDRADGLSETVTPICAIGASAGGVAALQAFFECVDDDLGLAYVVIVHLSPDHPSQLSQILAGRTAMPVVQVEDSPRIEPNKVYVIAPDRELVIEGDDVHARPFTEPRGRRAPIDMFFRSVAKGRGDGLAVMLSGAGSDGAAGARKVKEAGGVVFVQDPSEAEWAMMPRSAVATGAADFVAPVAELVRRLAEVTRSKQALRRLDEEGAEVELRQILAHLNARTGHDFSSYKRATVLRRIARRMQVARQDSLSAYAQHLRETPEEAQELFGDLLISVTAFFRDPAAWQALAEEALGPILDELEEGEPLRLWSVGCATGEEAYSLAILLLEETERRRIKPSIQIFATDLDEGALTMAREGRYPKSVEADLSEERLRGFFIDEGGYYRVRKEVRDLVLFSHHSALRDPPFIRVHLAICRNLLIYMERDLQRQLLALFHYALRPGGYLFLGSAETADLRPELFAPCDREARVYLARARGARGLDLLTELPREHRPPLPGRDGGRGAAKSPAAAHVAALEAAAPPSALVDEELRVLNLSRGAGRFLQPPEGPLVPELPEIARPELRAELRRALHRAFEARETCLTLPIPVSFEGTARRVTLHVAPHAEEDSARQALVLFLDAGPVEGEAGADDEVEPERSRWLEEELRTAQQRLALSRREHEGAIQELRVANEELQSINEEYRSTAEELETSKEELQSINEELQTVNAELQIKLDSIASAHSDLQNLINATDIGTLFLDQTLRIRMLTPAVEQLFNVTDSDVGRPITDFTHKLAYDGVERDVARVLRDLSPVEAEVATHDDRWLMMRIRPYRTVEDRIEGAVLSFVDITARRRAEAVLRESEARWRSLFESMDEGYLLAEIARDADGRPEDLRFLDANPAAVRMLKAEPEGRRLSEIAPEFGPEWRELPARALETGKPDRAELHAAALDQWFDVRAVRLDAARVVILFLDVTERKRHEAERELMVGELNHRVKNMLAVVASVARQTLRSARDPKVFAETFENRIQALAAAHRQLTLRRWRGSDLRALIQAALAGLVEGARLKLDGPAVELSPNATISMAMALHELGVNALKHGALSTPEGRVEATWRVVSDPSAPEGRRFDLVWRERDGPPVAPPSREGFGMRMLQRGIARELSGLVELDYDEAGLVCRMTFPTDGGVHLARD